MTLKKQVFFGLKWTAISSLTLTFINILRISVLARFLDKSDFGLMALVTFVLGFMNLFMDIGLSSAILHKQNISKQEYASLYWINICFSLILFGLIFIISPLISSFFKEPQLKLLIPIMSISIMLSALGRQFKTVEQKKLNFRYLAVVDNIGAVCSLIVGIVMAVLGYGVYALVFAAITRHAVSNSIYFIKGLLKQGMLLHFKYTETKPFLRIGIFQVGGQMINYFNRDLDILIIGKFFGTDILGGYSLAKELVRRPLGIITPIISKVGMSVFPKFQNDLISLKRYFLKLYNGSGIVNAFIYGSIAILAPYLVLLFYGPNFQSIVIYVQLFAIVIYFRSMGSNISMLIITTGRTDYEFYWNVIISIIMPLAIVLGATHSMELIIILLGAVQLVLLIPGWFLFYKKFINLDFFPFMKANLIPPIIATIIFVLTQFFFKTNLIGQILAVFLLFLILSIYGYKTLNEIRNIFGKFLKNIKIKFNAS